MESKKKEIEKPEYPLVIRDTFIYNSGKENKGIERETNMTMDWENYPNNYDFLAEGEASEILSYLNAGSTWQELLSPEKKAYARQLQERGIAARYGWAGHRGEWFLATVRDAEMEEDWRFQCAD